MKIRKWHLKAAVQKGLSYFPDPEKANHVFQKYVTKGIELNDEHFGYKIQHASDHIAYARKYLPGRELSILELGTGWYPIIPISFYLTGLGPTTSIDIQSWLSRESMCTAIEKMKDWRKQGKLEAYLPQIDEQRWQHLQALAGGTYSLQEMVEAIGMTPLLTDARKTDLPAGHFDFICSNNTFEHIYQEVLEDILIEFKRILKPNGLMSHFIDLSDHFAHFDTSINIYNFLQFSAKRWAQIDNSIQPQNRLRWKDYKAMYSRLQIPVSEEETREGDMALLQSVQVHEEYRQYSPEELAISHGYLISRFGK